MLTVFSLIRFLSESVTVETPYLLFLDEVTPRPLITTGGASFAYYIYFHFHVHAERVFFFFDLQNKKKSKENSRTQPSLNLATHILRMPWNTTNSDKRRGKSQRKNNSG